MEAKKRFKELLDSTTSEYGLPVYVLDVELAIDTLLEFMPESLLLEYIKNYSSSDDNMNFNISKYLQPVMLLIAGDDLRKLKSNQSDDVIGKIKTKFLNVRIIDSQLADLLAEIDIASLIGVRDLIDLDVDTGVENDKGKKNTDILHVNSNWYFEVKNFEFGKSNHEKRFSKKAHDIFSRPENAGKQFRVVKGRVIEEIGSQLNGSSISGELFTFRKQFANQIRNANSKFTDGQKAILVLYNVPFKSQSIEAIENWRSNQPDAKRIRSIIIIGRLRPSEGYTRETHTYFIEDDPKNTESFLKTLY